MKKSISTLLTAVTMVVVTGLGFLGCEKQGLSTPTGFKAVQEGNEIILTWNEMSGASLYEVTKNGSYWQSTSNTHLVDSEPKEGINSYELTAFDGEKQSNPAKTSCNFKTPASGGGDDPQTDISYYIKHPWNGGEWTWCKMTKDGSTYTFIGTWGGSGANINTSANDSGAEWYEKSIIKGSSNVYAGEKVIFTFYPTNGVKGELIVQADSEGSGDNPGGGTGSETLPAPTNFTLSQTSSCINLSWSKVSGATSYYVCRALPTDDQYSLIKATTSTSYADYDVSAGTTYYYAVAAVDANGEYGDLAKKSITFNGSSSGGGDNPGGGGSTIDPTPFAPTGLTAVLGGTKAVPHIELSWNYDSSVDHYNIYRSLSSSGTFSKIGTAYYSTYNDGNVSSGKTYYYKIKAANSSNRESSFSNMASCKVDIVWKPEAPKITSVKFSGTNNSTVTIKWDYVVTANWSSMPDQVKLATERLTKKGNYYVFDWTTATSKKSVTLTMDDLNYGDNNVGYWQTLHLQVKNSAGEAEIEINWKPNEQQVVVGDKTYKP